MSSPVARDRSSLPMEGQRNQGAASLSPDNLFDWFQDALVEIPWTKPPALVPDDWPDEPPETQ